MTCGDAEAPLAPWELGKDGSPALFSLRLVYQTSPNSYPGPIFIPDPSLPSHEHLSYLFLPTNLKLPPRLLYPPPLPTSLTLTLSANLTARLCPLTYISVFPPQVTHLHAASPALPPLLVIHRFPSSLLMPGTGRPHLEQLGTTFLAVPSCASSPSSPPTEHTAAVY